MRARVFTVVESVAKGVPESLTLGTQFGEGREHLITAYTTRDCPDRRSGWSTRR